MGMRATTTEAAAGRPKPPKPDSYAWIALANTTAAIFMASPGVPRQVTRIGVMSSTALIQLPDPTRYAQGWRDWRVELRIGDPGDAGRDVTLAAPKPPR